MTPSNIVSIGSDFSTGPPCLRGGSHWVLLPTKDFFFFKESLLTTSSSPCNFFSLLHFDNWEFGIPLAPCIGIPLAPCIGEQMFHVKGIIKGVCDTITWLSHWGWQRKYPKNLGFHKPTYIYCLHLSEMVMKRQAKEAFFSNE